MIVSIILVHALANRLGLRIFYPTLFAVAVLSFMVIFASSLLTHVAGKDYLLMFGLMIAGAALLVTLANNFLLKKEIEEELRFTEEVKAAYAAEIEKDSLALKRVESFDVVPPYNESVPTNDTQANVLDDKPVDDTQADVVNDKSVDDTQADVIDDKPVDDTQADVADDKPVDDTQADVVNDKPVDDTQADAVNDKSVDDTQADVVDDKSADDKQAEAVDVADSVEPDSSGKFPLDKVFKPLAKVKPEEADKPVEIEEKPDPADNFPLDEVFKPLAEVKNEEADKPVELEEKTNRADFFPLQDVFTPLSNIRLDKIEELTQEERDASPQPLPTDNNDADKNDSDEDETPDTLDDILDKAYNERAKGHVWQAIDLYKKALERYRNDDYAPFVAIDLGNIYKEQALILLFCASFVMWCCSITRCRRRLINCPRKFCMRLTPNSKRCNISGW